MRLLAALFTIGILLASSTPHASKSCPTCTHQEPLDPAASLKNHHKDKRDYIILLPPLTSGPESGYFDNCFVKTFNNKKEHKHARSTRIYMAEKDHHDSIRFVNETADKYKLTFDTWPFDEIADSILVQPHACSNLYHLGHRWAGSSSSAETDINTFVWESGHWKQIGRSVHGKLSNADLARLRGHQVGPVVAADD